ncbi:hypothetical protein [Bacillus cereus group sp. N21]|uniref:hypothetical protein n=1 Tax=Bacillus cereus group sp. N21 TaxID=2794591 RepID=UPI0018F75BC7|nr:hypothetical protein [Bacillus cereus group sp. N21]MBJ8030232.1 hypothetical protein [Bacillus cereus group sp. N21]
MPKGGPIPVVCYKKFNDGSEIVIEKFERVTDAIKWAKENEIMSAGAVQFTINTNNYLSNRASKVSKYPNRLLYRFARI